MDAFPLAVFGSIDWGIIGVYFALMIYIGVVAARKDQNAREYFLAHRSIPTWAVAISIVATSLSAATFVGVPDTSFLGDQTYLIFNLGGLLAVIIVAIWFVPKLYSAGTVTIYGYLNNRYGQGAMIAVSATFLFGRLMASASRLFIAAIPLCLLLFARQDQSGYAPTHGQLIAAILLIGGLGTFYTMFGGIRTVIWIDVIQFFLVIGAAFISLYLLLHKLSMPLSEIWSTLSHASYHGHSKLTICDLSLDVSRPYTLWSAIFGATCLNVAAFGVDQDLAQRFLVAKSVSRGALSLIWSQLISIVVVIMFLWIGLLLYVFYHSRAAGGSAASDIGIYPWFLLNQMPTVLSGLSIVGFFAIAQGSMDSAINALASSAVADVYEPLRRSWGFAPIAESDSKTPKLAVAAMGVCMTLIAIGCIFLYDRQTSTLIEFALGVMMFAYSGMLGVFLTALLTDRGSTESVIFALVAGLITVVWLHTYWPSHLLSMVTGRSVRLSSVWWMPVATLVSFAVCLCGSRPRRRAEGFAPILVQENGADTSINKPDAASTPGQSGAK